jgi:hypothetical protein
MIVSPQLVQAAFEHANGVGSRQGQCCQCDGEKRKPALLPVLANGLGVKIASNVRGYVTRLRGRRDCCLRGPEPPGDNGRHDDDSDPDAQGTSSPDRVFDGNLTLDLASPATAIALPFCCQSAGPLDCCHCHHPGGVAWRQGELATELQKPFVAMSPM